MAHPDWCASVLDTMATHQAENRANLPGATYGVETPEGRWVGSVGRGWHRTTICEIGSMTKPFLSAALLQLLEERHLLNIEQPVWRLPGMELYAEHPVGKHIRLRHLLQHTSGLPHFLHRSEWPRTPCNDPDGQPPAELGPRLDLGPTSEWIGAPALTNELMLADGRC